MTSNVNDLSARLRRRMADEDRETTAVAERELRRFGETLNASANDTLRITEAAMAAQVGRMHGLLWRGWIRCLASSTSAAQRQLFLPVADGCSFDDAPFGGRCCGF